MEKAKEQNRNETRDIIWKVRGTPKKRVRNKAVPQAVSTGKLSNSNDTNNVLSKVNSNPIYNSSNLKNISKKDLELISIWYTNADTFTKEKLQELKDDINACSPPDIIAITELKPKNYTKELTKVEYMIDDYNFEPANLEDRGSTRGVAIYYRKSLNCSKIDTTKIMGGSEFAPREVISISMNLENNKKLIFSNIYRSPHSTAEDNRNINKFFRSFSLLKHEHQVILGDFNRKSIDWVTAMSASDDDCEFIEATRDSFLTQHVSTPTRGRGTNDPSLIDLVFTSNEENIESINMHAPLGK